ncbi:MAG: cellobiose phosphorylase [Brevinematales bacterium]
MNFNFTDDMASFECTRVSRDLYFPLCNETGMMSSITPYLHGDSKTSNKSFILPPVTIEDLHNTRSPRNFWFYIKGKGLWSATGNSLPQALRELEGKSIERKVKAGLLWHLVEYTDKAFGLKSEILSFVPSDNNYVEIMYVKVKNIGNEKLDFIPTSAIQLYGRSAENIRDHRHVISLVNRVKEIDEGVILKPLIIFDERGHTPNTLEYYVLGFEDNGDKPVEKLPLLHSFIGKNGTLEWPEALLKGESLSKFKQERTDGQEVIGALRFKDFTLSPQEEKAFIILIGIKEENEDIFSIINKYNSKEKVLTSLEENKKFWQKRANLIEFKSELPLFDGVMKWINIQPVLRKIYGCSFLPHHDYGKGGRGWRDLWQDCLSLILQNPDDVRDILINNFAGVRIDGSNATIIGKNKGEFIADRNNIPRIWMDHGTWPFLTTKLYIDQTGDTKILFEKQSYFRDGIICRATRKDVNWTDKYGLNHKDKNGKIYFSTILEHILVQHLSSFFNVGEHNIMKLEGADWNDGIDKAKDRGESVAFTALYGYNLKQMAELLREISEEYKEIEMFEEIFILLDTLNGKPDYDNISYKNNLLEKYFESIYPEISGKTRKLSLLELAKDLEAKANWIYEHLKKNEWVKVDNETAFFNGYYNNDGKRVDGIFKDEDLKDGVRMCLTGQVFTLMGGIVKDKEAKSVYNAAKKYLKESHGGYKLNTPLGKDNQLNFGRLYAFAYGEKENGATFSHMVVMFMNALYKQGLIEEGFEVFNSIYNLCIGENADIYPGIPEYFTPEGKGMYHYLTGSASWFILTLLTEIYGVKGKLGGLVIEPKLSREFFGNKDSISIGLNFSNKRLEVVFVIEKEKNFYNSIKDVYINDFKMPEQFINEYFYLPFEKLNCYLTKEKNNIKVILV